jgi:predicted nucleotidyltransferase
MYTRQAWDYIERLTDRYPSVSAIWLLGSRAHGTERPESDWDLLVFADQDSFTAMREDADLHAPGIDLLVVTDGDRFEQPWTDEGHSVPKGGYLDTWRWTENSWTEATYLCSRTNEMVPAIRLWPRE